MTQNDGIKIPILQQEIISTNPNSASKFIRDAIGRTSNWLSPLKNTGKKYNKTGHWVVNIGKNIMNITNDLIGWF